MALRSILIEGDPTLRKKSREVRRFDGRLKQLAADMLETMRHDHGVGLAAPQVGILKRLFVMNVDDETGDHVIVNPRIIRSEGEQHENEGCLSLPGLYARVSRPAKVLLEYENLEGETLQMEGEGLKAICICHESDHLDGILFRDRAEGPMFRLEPEQNEEDQAEAEAAAAEKETL